MPGRNGNSGEYRYGAGGQEKTDEISGVGNHYTAEYWEMDPRLGRRWNIDPLAHMFPWQSPYTAFNNNPILMVDPKGLASDKHDDKYTKKRSNFTASYLRKHGTDVGLDEAFREKYHNRRWFKKHEENHSGVGIPKLDVFGTGGGNVRGEDDGGIKGSDKPVLNNKKNNNGEEADKEKATAEVPNTPPDFWKNYEYGANGNKEFDVAIGSGTTSIIIRFDAAAQKDRLVVKDQSGNELFNSGAVKGASVYNISINPSVTAIKLVSSSEEDTKLNLGIIELWQKK